MSQTASGGRRRFNRAVCAGVAASMAFAGLAAVSSPPAAAEVLLKETFKNASTTPGDWIAPSPKGSHSPCLTAAGAKPPAGSLTWCNAVRDGKAAADPVGSGAFQITDNSKDDAGGLILNRDLNARQGLHVEFDQFQYNTSTAKGADGISFFLMDGANNTTAVGDSGGWLGYRNLKGAFVGVGFDQFGNFSDKKYWGSSAKPDKGPGNKPNSVVVRGSQDSGYQYVTGKQLDPAAQPLAVAKAKKRDEARRTVNIDVSTAGTMNVYIDFHDGKGKVPVLSDVDLNKIPGQGKLPPKIQLGFAASTGASTDYHEIQNFSISTLDPDLATKVTPQGEFKPGGTGTFNVDVTNNPGAGPTIGPITSTFTIPDGLTFTSATGDGWTCKAEGPKVTCTRPGADPNALEPGITAPPIKVVVGIPPGSPPSVTLQATSDTKNESKPSDNTSAPVQVPVVTAAPDISVVTKPDGPFQAGGTGSTTTTVTNDKNSGPTNGKITAVVTAPEGTTIATSGGDGWTCKIADDKKTATCTTDKVIKPGESTPPIKTTYNVPAGTKGPIAVPPTKVTTPGETNTGNNTAPSTSAEVAQSAPNLTVTLDGSGNFVPGGEGTVTATVSNNKNAGPTNDKVTVTIPVPDGVKPVGSEGAGWTCVEAPEGIVCTRPGTGADALQPGASYPPIIVKTRGKAELTTPFTFNAKVDVKGDTDPSDNNAKPIALPKPGVQVGMTITPSPYEPGKKLTYTITVTNTGPNAATANLKSAVSQVWKGVPWTCTASAGSKCPAEPGKGDIDATITIAPGGSVVFTADCLVPEAVKVPLAGSATVTATGDPNCAKGCTVYGTSTATGDTKPTEPTDPTTPTTPVDPAGPLEQILQAKIDLLNKVLQGGEAPDQGELDEIIAAKLAALATAGVVLSPIIKAKVALLKKVIDLKASLYPDKFTVGEKTIQAKISLLGQFLRMKR